MCKAFQENKDIYATIASIAFNVPYEACLEFHPVTHEYQAEGKARRSEAKSVVLGICYGRSVKTIGEQLYSKDDISEDERTKKAQNVYDSVLTAFPKLRQLMITAQKKAHDVGYVETILGRRRHIPDMQLDPYEFVAMLGYVNPDIDPLDPNTLKNKSDIPERIVKSLKKEFEGYKYYGQIVKRTKQLYEEGIKVINNTSKIADASRRCVNSIVQGSAAELTKMAILKLENDQRWKDIGGRLLIPVHDELICEVPMKYADEAGKLLSEIMSDAGSFLPFTISCDVTTTLRWYGLEYPCPYTEPKSLENMTEDEIKWIQYMLVESEYVLPVFPDENGEKARGNAAYGVNGKITDDMQNDIKDYMTKYNLKSDEEFLSHIKSKVLYG